MAARFIFGRSGSGKTSYCVEQIVSQLVDGDDQQRLVFLVPEQATFQAESLILGDDRVAGYSRLSVVSFDRLDFLLGQERRVGLRLSKLSQQMIIHRILRQNRDKLRVFRECAHRQGLGSQMAGVVSELLRYSAGPDDVDGLVGRLDEAGASDLTVSKFADISLILRQYLEFIDGRFVDGDVELSRLGRRVAESGIFNGAKLWVDGFSGFTAAEAAVLVQMVRTAGDAEIALCLDADRMDEHGPGDIVSLFYPTELTYLNLRERFEEAKISIEPPLVLRDRPRFAERPALGHIEQNLFNPDTGKIKSAGSVRVVSCPNVRAEVRYIARQMLELVKNDCYRYRDIAVILPDMDLYEPYVRAVFEDYALPYFIDKKKLLNQHPAVRFIMSALKIATGGFGGEIFAYLKSDFAWPAEDDINLLENYCLANGVGPDDWAGDEDWRFAGPDYECDEEAVNDIRRRAAAPLKALRAKLAGDDEKLIGVEDFVAALFEFIQSVGIDRTLGQWIESATAEGDYSQADEHRQFYDRLMDMLDEMAEIFAAKPMTGDEYLAVMEAGFGQLGLAAIPPTVDQILVGQIERSRHPDLKVVFLPGCTQRQFPTAVNTGGILTDADRSLAEQAKFEIAPASKQSLIERRYLAYIAFTRARDKLCVTYPYADNGSQVQASEFVENLQRLFEDATVEAATDFSPDMESVHSAGELGELLCSELGRDRNYVPQCSDDNLSGLLEAMCHDDQLVELARRVRSALDYDNHAILADGLAEDFYGKWFNGSASRLGTFGKCPYRYFAQYMLALQKRQEYKIGPLDIGLFYHKVLEQVVQRILREKLDWAELDDERISDMTRQVASDITQSDAFMQNFTRQRRHNVFIVDTAVETAFNCAIGIAQMARAGRFRPVSCEAVFGVGEDGFGKFEIEFKPGHIITLNGKIDRIDEAVVDGRKLWTIFDYKTSGGRLSWSGLFYGLDVQLPLYMLAVEKLGVGTDGKGEVVGAFYVPIMAGSKSVSPDKFDSERQRFSYKARGLFNGDIWSMLDSGASGNSCFYGFMLTKQGQPYGRYNTYDALKPEDFAAVLEFSKGKIIELARSISEGNIEVRPYRLGKQVPCCQCDYRSLCRFDWQVNEYNILAGKSKAEVLGEIKDGNGG